MASEDEREDSNRQSHRQDKSERSRHREDRDTGKHRDRHRRSDREEKSSRGDRDRKRSRSRSPHSHHRRHRSRDRERDRDSKRSRPHRRDDEDEDRHRRRRRSGDDDQEKASGSRREHGRDRSHKQADDEKGKNPLRIERPLPSQADSFAVSKGEEPEKPKEKPNYGNTGLLAAESNSVLQADGTSIKLMYTEPSDARHPPAKDQWRMFVFKGSDIIDTFELNTRSHWLIGRDAKVSQMHLEHPSISKQHAIVQFRYIQKRDEYGDKIGKVKPYLLDLESANGTILNNDKIEDRRYIELRDKDMVQFGQSTREYVIMLTPKN